MWRWGTMTSVAVLAVACTQGSSLLDSGRRAGSDIDVADASGEEPADTDGQADTGPAPALDADGDGWAADVDCDDGAARIHPGAWEYCGLEPRIWDDCDEATPDVPALVAEVDAAAAAAVASWDPATIAPDGDLDLGVLSFSNLRIVATDRTAVGAIRDSGDTFFGGLSIWVDVSFLWSWSAEEDPYVVDGILCDGEGWMDGERIEASVELRYATVDGRADFEMEKATLALRQAGTFQGACAGPLSDGSSALMKSIRDAFLGPSLARHLDAVLVPELEATCSPPPAP
ncbi:MAG: hypothetical protein H6732_20200 [Alphaproteobacteria bacterium]|nr:hypothetical protein [Alphaproteobacteria bacterium]